MSTEIGKELQSGLLSQIQHYWHIILKWKWTVAIFFVVSIFVATTASFLLTPVYTASGSVWIEDDPNILPFENVQSFGADSSLQSHARLLKSRTLAADTIDKLKLDENIDFSGKRSKGQKPADPLNPRQREVLVQKFLGDLAVSPGERTRLIDVRFSNRNPKLAADILNALFDSYIDLMVRKRYSASEQASEFLNSQIAELRNQIEQKEKELNAYGSEKNILPLTAAEAPTISRISEVNSALTAATLDRVNKLNYYNQLKSAPLGEIPNAPAGSLIQRLREQYVTLSRQYATRLATVRPEYPEMQRLKSELDTATTDLQNETQNLIRTAYNDYQAALNKEQSLQGLLNSQRTEAYRANSYSVVYNSLRIELDNKKSLLEALSKRQSETDVSARLKGLEALNVWIVDKADYPLSPTYPDKKMNILIGLLFGLVGGLGSALGLEYLNHTIKTQKDVMSAIGVPTLGSVPAFETEMSAKGPKTEFARIVSLIQGKGKSDEMIPRAGIRERIGAAVGGRSARPDPAKSQAPGGKIELISVREPQSIQSESYRSLRTTLLVSSPPGKIKTILFTSPLAQEGKSSTISNLGVTLAEAGKRVVIVDSDLRKPRQARIFGVPSAGPGLSQYLSSHMDPSEIVKLTGIENLQLITSGPPPVNPIELITSEKMDSLVAYLKRSFDFVLFDAPPLLAVSDALAMGPMADAIILIARAGQTPVPAMKQAKQKLDAHKLKCLGVIINSVDLLEQDGYYARQYYHYSKADKPV